MSWVGCYSFCLTAVHVMGDNIDIQAIPDRTIRPQRLVTNVEKPEQVVVRDLLVAGQSQLAGPLDMFMFSLDYCREVREDFLKECGLAGATDEQIDDYLDASDLEMPTPGRIDLPVFKASVPVRVIGRFIDPTLKQFCLNVIGPMFVP